MRIIVGITGASGSIYACTLIRALHALSMEIIVIASEMGARVLEYECGTTLDELSQWACIADNRDLFNEVASGSSPWDGMVIVPCSMHTLAAVANGLGDTLLTRTAAIALKEGRRLVAVIRETPYSLINIENMAKVTKAGGCIMPACPGFYSRPTEIWQLVQSITGKIMDQLGVKGSNMYRWKGRDTKGSGNNE